MGRKYRRSRRTLTETERRETMAKAFEPADDLMPDGNGWGESSIYPNTRYSSTDKPYGR
jgi:hypothetical protein